MLAIQNTIGIKLGLLQGNAEGPLGIGALVLIVVVLLLAWRRRPR
jgi:MYXO-CTERM domain-containing protein